MYTFKRIITNALVVSIIVAICNLVSCKDPHNNKSEGNDYDTNSQTGYSSLKKKEELGKLLFFEKSLSTPPGQDCSFCHSPDRAFADPETELPVSKGAQPGTYGNRNDMTVSYSAFIPPLHFDEVEGIWKGGLFWDGRANNLAEQAQGPPLNPLEMANPDTMTILKKLEALPYNNLFTEVYGADALSNPSHAFLNMSDAIAAYEKSPEVNPFTSKYDYWLKGEADLTDQEISGLGIFVAENKGNCAACHPNMPLEDGSPPIFSDFTYDNLGTPKNPENPFYNLSTQHNPDGFAYVDLGLGTTVNDPAQNGKFRVPTLRNVEVTAPYMHNGVFKTLFNVVAFYNTRDLADWPDPEVSENVNKEEMGNLELTTQEMEDLVTFLKTLTDGWNNNKK